MTYSLNTLTRDGPDAAPAAPVTLWSRFAQEILLLLSAGLLLFLTAALWSYHPQDPAWSTSGSSAAVRNGVGRWGAWVADLAYFMFGFSAWWCVVAGYRAWLVALARWLRGVDPQDDLDKPSWQRSLWVFWLGLAVLLVASCGLEWTRLYRLETGLPGHSGGVLGYWAGAAAERGLGFNGSALLGIVLCLVGVAMVFRFSWGQLAEKIGAQLDALIRSRHEKREIEEDMALGQQALRERQQALSPLAIDPEWDVNLPGLVSPEGQLDLPAASIPVTKAVPRVIESPVMDVPRRDRVVKERQKPLFNELPDSKLPQVDLLDSLSIRQETVSPDTLEMTSRLIEKKLKDFGVEVRVVAAAPGPVITRYEIEPATGVKGSQVVNLAKDLARSLSLVSIRVHGAFVSDEEVHRVVNYLKSQGEPDYIEGVLEGGTTDDDGGMLAEGDNSEKDPMYDQAVEVVLKNRKASISLVQRHLKIGYNRAARLVEDMEKAGLVSAMSGSGQREILVPARAE